jgi:hypothetical protein
MTCVPTFPDSDSVIAEHTHCTNGCIARGVLLVGACTTPNEAVYGHK